MASSGSELTLAVAEGDCGKRQGLADYMQADQSEGVHQVNAGMHPLFSQTAVA